MMTKRDYDDNRNGLNRTKTNSMELFLSFLAGFPGDVKKDEKNGN